MAQSEFKRNTDETTEYSTCCSRESALESILTFSKDLIFIFDRDQRFSYVGSAGADAFNSRVQDLIGNKWTELELAPDAIRPLSIGLNAVFDTGKPLTGETLFREHKELKSYEYTLSPVKGEEGEIESVVAVFRDTTERRRSIEKLEAIRQIGVVAGSTVNLDEVLNYILEGALRAAGASGGMIFLKDHETGYLKWGASIGLSESFTEAFKQQQIKPGEGLSGRVMQTGEAVYIAEDSSHDPRIARPVVEAEGLNSFVGMPIRAEDEVIGVINIVTRPPNVLDEREIDTINSICAHVGFALRNARSFAELKKLEEALKQSEEKFRTVFEKGPLGIILLGKGNRFLSVNDKFCDMVGYSRKELENMSFEDITLPEDIAISRERAQAVFSGEAPKLTRMEKRYVRKDGETIWVSLSSTPILDDKGRVKHILTMFEDMTERKAAAQFNEEYAAELKASENRYKTILRTSLDGFWLTTADGRFLDANDAYCRLIGYSYDELLRMRVQDVEAAEKPEETERHMRRIIETGADRFETRHRRKDGKILDIEVSVNYMSLAGGRFFVFLRDITEEKRAARFSAGLNKINAVVSSTLNLDEIMETAVRESAQAVGAESAAVALLENDFWITSYAYGLPEDFIGRRFSEEELHFVMLAKEGKGLMVSEDAFNDERIKVSLIHEYGVRSVLAVPLVIRNNIIGIIAFFNLSGPVGFTQGQKDFAVKSAASISLALENVRLYQGEHNIADTLQEALLTMPEKMEGIEFGSLYHSATESARVGGDFFDLFRIDQRRIGLIAGDVSGKGLEAAALTSLVKNVIKAYSFEGGSPASIIAGTNLLLAKTTDRQVFITVFFGILDLDSQTLDYCNAGHPFPIIKGRKSQARLLKASSPVVGVLEDMDFSESREVLRDDDILLLYTDGVTEARRNNRLFGEESLLQIVDNFRKHSAKTMPQFIYDRIVDFTGGKLSDDIALLAVTLDDKRAAA